MEQVAQRPDGSRRVGRADKRLVFRRVRAEVRPTRGNQRPRPIRQNQRQVQRAPPVRQPHHPQKLSLERMAFPHHADLRRQVLDVGSVS